MTKTRLAWAVGAMTADEWAVYSVRERLLTRYGYETRILSILVRNSSDTDLTEESTREVIETGERKKITYDGGADYVALKADAATNDGEVTVGLEVEH